MTQEEQDAILGRTMRDYKLAKNKLGALKKLNSEIAAAARALATALVDYPDRIHVSKGAEGTLIRANALYEYSTEDARGLSPEFLREHLHEYVSVQQRKADLRQELINQGEDDPEK
jgi:hypothetical protein